MKKLRAVLLVVLVLAGLIGSATPARAGSVTGWFDYVKNARSQSNSTLYWTWGGDQTPNFGSLNLARAGSGWTKNDCEKGKGWLPNGLYDQEFTKHDYNGGEVFGRVWKISSKKCAKGTVYRSDLFIHTEETPQQGQSCIPNKDSNKCWEGNDDYTSAGCIKVAWSKEGSSMDIANVHKRYHDPSLGGYPGDVNVIPYILRVR